jgi:Holliday junction resolvase-like predicted endonuclease
LIIRSDFGGFMPERTRVPEDLLKKIRRFRPDIFELLQNLELAHDKNDSCSAKSIRIKLRNNGFYLSRLKEGNNPFIHDSLLSDTFVDNNFSDDEIVFMTEDEVVKNLCIWLKDNGWKIMNKCLGHEKGIDILATNETQNLIVEAKGSKGNTNSQVTKREKFSKSQIKKHFGYALIKLLEEKNKNPGAIVAIAQPDDPYLKECLSLVIPEVINSGIKLYWVSRDGQVKQDWQ